MFRAAAIAWRGLSGAGLVLALALSACTASHSLSGAPASASATKPATPSAGAPTAAGLRAALLTAADLPPGYTAHQVTGSGLGDSSLAGCPALTSDPKGTSASAGVVLVNSAAGSSVSETLLQMSVAEAVQAMGTFARIPAACRSFTGRLEGAAITFTSAPLRVSSPGGQTTASRITGKITGLAVSLYVDVVVIRYGGTLIEVSTVGSTADTAFTEHTADKAYTLVARRG